MSSAIQALAASQARLERQLAKALEMGEQRATFLATMSHELREPMNGVLGMARLLHETVLDDEQRNYVEAVIDSAQSLLTIINDILDLSRIDAGKLDLVSVDFSLPIFFERLSTMLRTRAESKGIALRLDLANDLPVLVRGDPGRLRQILVNLCGNALKFTSEGAVTIHASSGDQGGVAFAVEDTGAGIPDELQTKLFTAFAQADSTVPRLFGGAGLGLMISQRLVQAMGGDIAVQSEVGTGTRFDFSIQFARPSGRGEAGTIRADLAGAALLVVDAQPRSRQVTCELAQLWQMQARGTASAKEARAALQEAVDRGQPFDIVLIDRSLPDGAGDRLGESLRDNPAMAHLKLVLMVASGMRGDAARARESGFDAYLPKPLTPSTLLDCLQQIHASDGGELVTIHSMSESKRTKMRLLIADDNPVNCKLAAIMLQRAGHEVEIAENGAKAVEMVESGNFDAVLMDVQMPVMNGLEATRRIRTLADRQRARIPVIAITANAMQGEDRPCYDAGMNAYVTKPIDRAALLAALDRLVA